MKKIETFWSLGSLKVRVCIKMCLCICWYYLLNCSLIHRYRHYLDILDYTSKNSLAELRMEGQIRS